MVQVFENSMESWDLGHGVPVDVFTSVVNSGAGAYFRGREIGRSSKLPITKIADYRNRVKGIFWDGFIERFLYLY